jgi:hypothetical protein
MLAARTEAAQEILMTRAGEGEVSAESTGQRHFSGLPGRERLNRPLPGRAGSTVDQNRAKTLWRKAVWSKRRVEIGS